MPFLFTISGQNAARAWNQHIACGALMGGSYAVVFVKRAPASPFLKDFVRAGRFLYTPRNIITGESCKPIFALHAHYWS